MKAEDSKGILDSQPAMAGGTLSYSALQGMGWLHILGASTRRQKV